MAKKQQKKKKAKLRRYSIWPWIVVSIVLFAVMVILPFTKKPNDGPIGCIPKDESQALLSDYDPSLTKGEFLGSLITVPPITEKYAYVLGDQNGSKRIEVNLAAQKVYAYDGDTKVFEFIVSTGKWAPTPRGEFTIERKVRAQKMSGGSKEKGTYYYLPNVPWVMFFGNKKIPWSRGFSFHGAYWHNNFGSPMSHGCVNMKIPESEQLYNWAPVGTPVKIY